MARLITHTRNWLHQTTRNLARVRCSRYGHLIHTVRMEHNGEWFYYCGRGCGVHVELRYDNEAHLDRCSDPA